MQKTYYLLALLLLVLIAAPLAYPQQSSISSFATFSIRSNTSDPLACQPWANNIFINRNSTPVLKICTDDSPVVWDTIPTATSIAATYLKLDASNDPLTGSLLGVAGSAASPSFAVFAGTGMFKSADNVIGFSTNNTERWVINASGGFNCATDGGCVVGNGAADPATVSVKTGVDYRGVTSGTVRVIATAIAGSNTLTLPAATDTLTGKATTDELTNKTFKAGSGTATFTACGPIYSTATTVGTDADTAVKTLATYTVPSSTLASNGKYLVVRAGGRFAATATTKTVNVNLGATPLTVNSITTAPNAVSWIAEHYVSRNAATTAVRRGHSEVGSLTTAVPQSVTVGAALSWDHSTNVVVSVTAQNGTANLNDILLDFFTVEACQ